MPFTREAEAALLKWVNTFPLDSQIASLADLSDGLIFSQMLEDLDHESAISELEKNAGGSSKWLQKKMCLEAVYKSLLRFIRNHIGDLQYVTVQSDIDLDKIAERDDGQQTMKLLVIFLMATLNTKDDTKRAAYIMKIQKLDEASQVQIMNIADSMSKLANEKTIVTNEATLPGNINKDFDLAFEEEHATLHAEHETLKKKHADFITRFEALQISNDDLHEKHNTLTEELATLREKHDSGQVEYIIKDLRSRISELETVIASHEAELDTSRITKEKQERELNALRRSAENVTKLDDEVRVLKVNNEALTKKANMVDHYQKKLESLSSTDKENQRLRERVENLEYLQSSYDEAILEKQRLTDTIKEYEKVFEQHENQLLETKRESSHYQSNLQSRMAEIERLNNKSAHDEQYIKDLQEQMASSGGAERSSRRSSTTGDVPMSLEAELGQLSPPTGQNLQLENSRLRAEIKLLQSGTSNVDLRNELESTESSRKRLEENLQALTEKYALTQEQLLAVIDTTPGDKDTAIRHTREAYQVVNEELSITKSKVAELEAELADNKRELLAAKADLEAIASDEHEALENLKQTNDLITSSLHDDLQLLQSRQKTLDLDFQQTQRHLIEALLAKDKIQQELNAATEGKPLDQTTALDHLKEHSIQQEKLIDELQKRLRLAEEEGVDAQKTKNEELIRNLTKENALMTTAWYDLTSRLQSNHVVLQRRQDAPKSWLNRQRQMVNTTQRR
ncbi:hypothetical protein B0O99DRAFT_626740 [Bisporella sp. PMI_857]|nr:hypothetical protein B0O99DRAFT_626740 [Bisporella sp. PMI_857]